MFQFIVDAEKAHAIPSSLKEWTAQKGPFALVRELSAPAASDAASPVYTLKGWTSELGPHAKLAQFLA